MFPRSSVNSKTALGDNLKMLKALKKSCKNGALTAEEIFRLILLRNLMIPLAKYLPRSILLVTAELFSMILLLFDYLLHGHKQYSRIQNAFNLNKFDTLHLSLKQFSLPNKDCAVASRILNGKEKIEDWVVHEVNNSGVDALRKAGQSYIVANGHFTRQAYFSLLRKDITPGTFIQVAVPLNPDTGWKAYDQRIEAQLSPLFNVGSYCRSDFTVVDVGRDLHAFRNLRNSLREPGKVVLINIDAPWEGRPDNSHESSFAGFANRKFANGVIGLARITGCPVVPCVTATDGEGNIVLEWGDPVFIARDDSHEAQVQVLNGLLDILEIGIGKRPAQYLMGIGSGRYWDKECAAWLRRDIDSLD